MNRVDLDTDIDDLITNKTAPNSLTPADEGSALKLVATYAEGLNVVKKTITHSELLTISSVPVEILPAVSGKMYIPKDIVIKYNDNDGWGSAGTWRILLGSVQMTNFVSQMGGGTTQEQWAYLLSGNPSNTNDSFFNVPVFISSSADPTVPVNEESTVTVYLTYFTVSA